MSDFYEQPEYLKETDPDPIVITEDKPKQKIPGFLVFGLIALVAVTILILLFSGLSGQGSRTVKRNQPDEQTGKKVVLQWWGVFLDRSVVQPLIDEYQALNPNVTIEYSNKWPQGKFYDSAITYRAELNRILKENDPVKIPDIFMINNTWAADYEQYTKPSNNIDFDTLKSTFYKSVVSDFGDEATKSVYGLPMWIDTFAIAYNKDLLLNAAVSTPPTSWATFKSLAQNLTVRNGGTIVQAGFSAGVASNTSFAMELFNILMRQNGVQIVNRQGITIFSESPNTLIALEYYKSFIDPINGTWSSSLPKDTQLFVEGKLAMMIVSSYRLREIIKANEDFNLGLNIGVSQIPQLPGQSEPIHNWVDYWGNMVALNRPNSQSSWRFLEWLSQPEQYRKLSRNIKNYYGVFGILYPRLDMSDELKSDEYLKVFNESLRYAESWDMVKGLEVREEFDKLLNQALANQNNIAKTNNAIQLILTLKGKLG
ncbi:extracellular solute-binding protein [Candidatus Dojkabacteria bacterium]|uniref:Extracellular solute-binding protein n=1 Tax=Candidatus Dojkabacteria bacterium TaxID=2099670 RepID=A0A3M0Z271_9BACT|nr:MAG: extracellular solute-binding protein [Candidatus Dojkabacteria bacterium]